MIRGVKVIIREIIMIFLDKVIKVKRDLLAQFLNSNKIKKIENNNLRDSEISVKYLLTFFNDF